MTEYIMLACDVHDETICRLIDFGRARPLYCEIGGSSAVLPFFG